MKKIIAYILAAVVIVALVMAGSVTSRAAGYSPSSLRRGQGVESEYCRLPSVSYADSSPQRGAPDFPQSSTPAAPLSEGSLAARQEEVHAAAELLRSLGVDEDDQAIQALSAEWWRCETLKSARYLGVYTVTGYDAYCKHCCARADGITASGAVVTEGYTVAMCRDFPFGTKVYIEGLGIYEVQDRGVGPGKIDIAMGSHKECYDVTGRYKVWILG